MKIYIVWCKQGPAEHHIVDIFAQEEDAKALVEFLRGGKINGPDQYSYDYATEHVKMGL